jgi:hypothetical protein
MGIVRKSGLYFFAAVIMIYGGNKSKQGGAYVSGM